jgi:hypothetical protein
VKSKDGINQVRPVKKGVSIFNKDVVVFAFFLFVSFLFWYFNSLGKEIEADINYPLTFVNIPKERIISEESQDKLNINLKGQGYSILRLKVSGTKVPLKIDISKVLYIRVPGSKSQDYYLLTSGLVKNITAQLKSTCVITAIKPDTLFFSLERIVARSEQSATETAKRK